MTKLEFLNQLELKLERLPSAEIQKSLGFYAEMIDDRVEDGMGEADAVAGLGDIDQIANDILLDTPLPRLVMAQAKSKHTLRGWQIVLMALGSPLWLSLLLAFWAVVLAVYVSIWAVLLSLWAGVVALGAGGIAAVLGCPIFFAQNGVFGLFVLGGGLICLGLCILSAFGMVKLSVWLVKLTVLFIRSVKKIFIKKEKRQHEEV